VNLSDLTALRSIFSFPETTETRYKDSLLCKYNCLKKIILKNSPIRLGCDIKSVKKKSFNQIDVEYIALCLTDIEL
jgi:hypothetical protein